MRRDAALLIAGLAGLSALSVVGAQALPAFGTDGARPGSITAAAGDPTTGTPTTGSTPAALPRVARPWTPGTPQLGVDLYWRISPGEKPSVTEGKISDALSYIVARGANAVSVSFPFVTTGLNSDVVEADPAMTPTPAQLGDLLRQAKDRGLFVTVRPLLDETVLLAADPARWRGTITPAKPAAWFANYTRFLLPYAQQAQTDGANAFYVGTELTSMEHYTASWTTLIDKVKTVYTGQLAYSMNYNRLVPGVSHVPDVQQALDAYFPLPDLGDNATSGQVAAGWNQWLDQYSTGALPDLVISETGIMAQHNAFHVPYGWKVSAAPNNQVQSTWFTAACQVAQQRHVAGLYVWYLDLEVPAGTAYPMGFQNTPAADVIQHCFDTYPRS